MSTYKITKILDGLPHFAEVKIKVIEKSYKKRIIDRCEGKGWIRQGYLEDATKNGYDDWKEGAKQGILSALIKTKTDKTVELLRISGLETDTNPKVVSVTAELATLKALKYKISEKEKMVLIESMRGSWKNI